MAADLETLQSPSAGLLDAGEEEEEAVEIVPSLNLTRVLKVSGNTLPRYYFFLSTPEITVMGNISIFCFGLLLYAKCCFDVIVNTCLVLKGCSG